MNTNRPVIILFLCIMISLTATSCLRDDDSKLKINIDEEFDVTFYEALHPGENKLVIHVSTKEDLDCSNYDLEHSSSASSSSVIVSIDDLKIEGDCDDIASIAQTDAHLGALANGVYNLELNLSLNSITNTGKLTVTNQGYEFEMETTHGITLMENKLRSIPDDYFWGYVELINNNASDVRDDFLSALDSFSRAAELTEGFYGNFSYYNGKAELNRYAIDHEIPDNPNTFIYKMEGDRQALIDYVLAFQVEEEDVVKIVLFTGDGAEL